MSTKRGKRYTEDQRQELLELFRQSALSASRFCKETSLSYPTLKRWLGPEPAKSMQFVELAQSQDGKRRLSVALSNGLWVDVAMDSDKSVVSSWIRELKAC